MFTILTLCQLIMVLALFIKCQLAMIYIMKICKSCQFISIDLQTQQSCILNISGNRPDYILDQLLPSLWQLLAEQAFHCYEVWKYIGVITVFRQIEMFLVFLFLMYLNDIFDDGKRQIMIGNHTLKCKTIRESVAHRHKVCTGSLFSGIKHLFLFTVLNFFSLKITLDQCLVT